MVETVTPKIFTIFLDPENGFGPIVKSVSGLGGGRDNCGALVLDVKEVLR